MKKKGRFFYLSTCSTCQRIIKEVGVKDTLFDMQDIKTEKISPEQIDAMKSAAGSYESLFSRVALKYRALGLNNQTLGEKDYRRYILEEYTFLKRPVALIGNEVFIGNSPSNVAALKKKIATLGK
jgi:arsenate reductase (glutaredoxin)